MIGILLLLGLFPVVFIGLYYIYALIVAYIHIQPKNTNWPLWVLKHLGFLFLLMICMKELSHLGRWIAGLSHRRL